MNKLRKLSYDLFKGKYKTSIAPDKIKNEKNEKKPKQLCNIWKSNYSFLDIVFSKKIAKLASELTGWNGIRLNQDSLFLVPPKAGGVSMHQDEVYQDWHIPGKIITAWVALTDVSEKNAGLKYIIGKQVRSESEVWAITPPPPQRLLGRIWRSSFLRSRNPRPPFRG